MSFSSFQFIFLFLPLAYAGFLLAHRFGGWPWAIHFLAFASLAFYGMFGIHLLLILLGSISFNYLAGRVIANCGDNRNAARLALGGAITANLFLLGYLKYTNFFIDILNQFAGASYGHHSLLLTVGVSFFTFIQIGYLVDAFNGQLLPASFSRYVVFAGFFPCITAGPLVMQREIMEQLQHRTDPAFDLRRVATGLTMFGMGLFKKVVLADSIAPYANTVFDGVAAGAPVDQVTAWLGACCYTLQLYFDFSGYSDMAIGLAFLFGIRLPLNFDSPIKATNISEFWRRWHMTMTRFFTSYIYSGLAMKGMRSELSRNNKFLRFMLVAAIPSVITFLIAGAWHGAGWNFVVYGLVHGFAIAGFLAWREFSTVRLPAPVGWALTLSVVITGLVIFRAHDLGTAGTILANMWGLGAFGLVDAIAPVPGLDIARAASFIVLLGAIVLLLPNTQQILHRDWVSSDAKPASAAADAGLLAWRPAFSGALAIGFGYTIALTSIGAGTGFLYYQF
jgi:D-alanyl-lipoteichoic acid acyltransferase DltB (MBOAT superfamily)